MFGNPVAQKVIRPFGSPSIVGDFRVTAPFGAIDANHLTPHIGVDIGNGKCGEPLLAMTTGRVSFASTINGAKVIRIVSDEFPDYEVAVAHCATIEVALNQRVTRGQRIGTLGASGTTACHCHMGCKHKGVEIDIWPLLDQNRPEEEMLKGTFVSAVSNKRGLVAGANTRFRSSPFVKADNVLAEFDAGAAFDPDFIVKGTTVGTDPNWYAGWGKTALGWEFGYIYVAGLGPLSPIEVSTIVFTQEQVNAKVAQAVAPYANRITGIKTKASTARSRALEVVALADDIAND